jgi:TolB-like protein
MRSQPDGVHSHPPPAEARRQLNRILSSPDFILPDRGRRFLQFIVNETLEARAAYLKAFTIATSVFGRDASFDMQNDPCVRMAARQLRSALERYYLTSGSMDEVLITVPAGSYVPIFVKRAIECSVRTEDEAQSVSAATKPSIEQASIEPQKRESRLIRGIMIGAVFILLAAVVMASIAERDNPVLKQAFTTGRPTILVKPFTTNDETTVPDEVLSGLTNEIVVNLVRFNGLVVIAEDGKPRTNEADTTYTLQGSIRLDADDVRAIARLVRGADGAVVWSSDYDVNIKGRSILDAQMAIAQSIAAAVAAPFGVGATSRPQG